MTNDPHESVAQGKEEEHQQDIERNNTHDKFTKDFFEDFIVKVNVAAIKPLEYKGSKFDRFKQLRPVQKSSKTKAKENSDRNVTLNLGQNTEKEKQQPEIKAFVDSKEGTKKVIRKLSKTRKQPKEKKPKTDVTLNSKTENT